jgi:hypothetical protein
MVLAALATTLTFVPVVVPAQMGSGPRMGPGGRGGMGPGSGPMMQMQGTMQQMQGMMQQMAEMMQHMAEMQKRMSEMLGTAPKPEKK